MTPSAPTGSPRNDLLAGWFKLQRQQFSLDASLTIPDRGLTGIFGPSGSGKTTLLRCIAGLERAGRGELTVDGETWQDEQGRVFLPPWKRPIGFVFQEPRLFAHLSVRENLLFGQKRKHPGDALVTEKQVVEMLGIGSLLARKPDSLSGGEQQRVAIGRALLTNPKLVLMDEPLTGLDRARKEEVMPFLERLHRELEMPVIMVSHHLEELIRLADALVMMEQGRIGASGPLAEMLTRLDSPLAREDNAISVVEGVVTRREPEYGLVWLETPFGPLALADCGEPEGTPLRANIKARDVSICLERPGKTSILNIIPATVVELAGVEGQRMVKLDAAGVPLLARITARSASSLGLRPGLRVFAQVKTVSLLPR
ncbi:MAG: molybdenum ABC transporter ATP-binding protein [Deltaproteobacteria bacterium]|nr:molybdenum ABC transporter ATP-binding protein [Deltaproteobacteria bacterium]